MNHREGYWVYAVVYSNYEPKEVDSLYGTRELADQACADLNEKAAATLRNSDNWEVNQMWVHT